MPGRRTGKQLSNAGMSKTKTIDTFAYGQIAAEDAIARFRPLVQHSGDLHGFTVAVPETPYGQNLGEAIWTFPEASKFNAAMPSSSVSRVTGPTEKGEHPTTPTISTTKVESEPVSRRVSVNKVPGSQKFRPLPGPLLDGDQKPTAEDEHEVHKAQPGKFFLICDAPKVISYMKENLLMLQQQVCKKMAKVVIKGIHPKKQANFPYQQKKVNQEGGESSKPPGWWPSVDLCPFIEPDHVTRNQRVNLLVHLIRLRPTVDELKEYTGSTLEPNKTHLLRGWTAWLQELVPTSVFDDLAPEPQDKINRRPELLDSIWMVAEQEENYKFGGSDGTTMILWTPNPILDAISAGVKRSRRRSPGSTISDDENNGGSPESIAEPRRKKAKLDTEDAKPTAVHDDPVQAVAIDRSASTSTVGDDFACDVFACDVHSAQLTPNQLPAWETTGQNSLNSSFSSTYDGFNDPYGQFPAYDACADYKCHVVDHYQPSPQAVQVYKALPVAQPELEALPRTVALPSTPFGLGPLTYGAINDPVSGMHPLYENPHGGHIVSTNGTLLSNNSYLPVTRIYEGAIHAQQIINMQASHGVRPAYEHTLQTAHRQNERLEYPARAPDANLPSDASPGHVERGFTGHGSGTDGGAWT